MDTILINDLINELHTIEDRYNIVKNSETNFDFYEVVYPYSQAIDTKLENLIKLKPQIIQLSYMNANKFDLLIKSYKELSVDCHFYRTSKKLFNEKLKSVNYDLNYIYQTIEG